MTSYWPLFGDPTAPVSVTGFPIGASFDTCHAGSVWFQIDSANVPSGTYVLCGMIKTSAPGITATCELVNLTDEPDVTLAQFSETSEVGMIAFSAPVSFASPGSLKTYGVKTKVTNGSAQIWGIQLVNIA